MNTLSIAPITSSTSDSGSSTHKAFVLAPQEKPNAPHPETSLGITEDTVHLSPEAMVQRLAQQGESPSVIADSTGLSISEINGDLGVVTSSSITTVTAHRSHGGGHPQSATSAPAISPAANTTLAATSALSPFAKP